MKRITSKFDKRLAGKTIERVDFGGQFFWIVFTDGTFVFLDAHSYAMNYESEISDHWKVDIGLMSQDEYREIEESRKRRSAEFQERQEREALAALKKKYEPTTN